MNVQQCKISIVSAFLLVAVLAVTAVTVSAQDKPVVAVLDFYGTGATQGDLVVFTNRLRTNLLNTGKYIVMDRATMQTTLREKGISAKNCSETSCASEIGKALGVQFVVLGSLDRLGNVYTLNLRLVESGLGSVANSTKLDCVDCTIEDLLSNTLFRAVRILAGLETLQPSDTASFNGNEIRVSMADFEANSKDTTPKAPKVEKLITYGGDLEFASRYMWHGIPLTTGPVLQPDVWISMYGVTASLWLDMVLTNLELDDNGNAVHGGTVDDFELIVDYSYDFNKLLLAPSLTFYFLPTDAMTAEFALKLSYPIWLLSVFSTHTIDFIAAPGAYFGDIGAAYNHSFNDQLGIKASVAMGWASKEFNASVFDDPIGFVPPEEDHRNWSLNAFSANLSLSYAPIDILTIIPHASLDIPMNKAVKNAIVTDFNRNEDASLFFSFGLGAALEF